MKIALLHRWRPLRQISMSILLVLTAVVSGLQAQDERPTSLDIVPQSATFYLASMNHAAQFDAIVESNAWKQLKNCDVAKRMRRAYRSGRRNGFAQFGWGNPFANYLEGYAGSVGSVPGKMALNYLSDIFGNEVFVFGDDGWIRMSRAMGEFYKEAGATMADIDLNEIDAETIGRMLEIGREHMAGVNTPRLVMGTVLDSPGGTKSLLQMAELGIDELFAQIPDELEYVVDAYDVIEEGDLYMLTFQLNSEMMPWEELEGDSEFEPYLDDIKAILSDKSINISLGVKGQFLLFSIGPDNKHILGLGEGDLLIDHPRLASLKAAAAKHPMTSVRYTSEELANYNQESLPGLIDTIVSVAKIAITSGPPETTEKLDGLVEDLESNADELKSDLMANLPRPGAYLGYSYIVENGIEGFMYNWGENTYLDSSRPLTILDHVGERPTLFAAGREKGDQGQYAMARKWAGRAYDLVMEYGPRTVPPRDAEMFTAIGTELRSILSEVAESTQVNLLEATRGCQSALVMDFTTAKKSWHPAMPPSDVDLPIPSFSVLIEHHDREKILAAGSSYLKAAVDISEMIRELPDSNMPDEFVVPDPLKKEAFGGDLYYYELPTETGMDPSLALHALVRDDLLVLGYSLDQTERLLASHSPRIKGLLADRSRNLMSAEYYNNQEMVDALYAWLKYGIDVARRSGETFELDQDVENDLLAFKEPELMEALDHVVALLRCFESSSSISWMDDGVQVTRYQLRFKDVPAK